MGAAAKLLTFSELRALVDALPEGTHGEVLGPGVWRAMSRPGLSHRLASRRILARLGGNDAENGGAWWFEIEAELLLNDRLYVPDLAGWRVEEGDLAFLDENPIVRPPDWACEVLSRSTQRADRVLKLPVYAAAGVAHVWIVDPPARTIEVYAPRDGVPALVASCAPGEVVLLPPFGVEIDVAALFSRPGRGP